MHQLILMRHAKAERAKAGLADHERALTPEGRKAAAAMGSRLQAHGVAPDVVLVSSARRTRETLDAIGAWEDQPNIEVLQGLYMASPAQLRDIIRDLRETVRSVLVIGHNPGIHELAVELAQAFNLASAPESGAGMLTSLRSEFPTASFADYLVLTSWRDLKPSSARLQRYLGPAAPR
jgi:phosphohistidine phosphatase